MQYSLKNPLKVLPILLLLAAYAGAAFGVAGNVQFVIGDAKLITRAGETRALQKGAEINEGDRIVTAAGASAQLKMADGGFIAVRPSTDMSFDTYRYSGKEDGTESAVVSLLQGGFRTITGLIGRTNKQNYLVKTATATIGIRGTDHEPMVILAPLPGQVAIAEAGTYDKVNVGIAFIRTDAGSVDIHRNQVGFAPETNAKPRIVPPPSFYKAATPPPGTQKAAASGEKAAEPPAQIRDTAAVDPTGTVSTGASATATPVSPAANAPVVLITTLPDATGNTVNLTADTQASSTGVTTPLSSTGVTIPGVTITIGLSGAITITSSTGAPIALTSPTGAPISLTSAIGPSGTITITSSTGVPIALTSPTGVTPIPLSTVTIPGVTITIGPSDTITITSPTGATIPLLAAQAAADAAAASALALNTRVTTLTTAESTAPSTTASSAVSAAQTAVSGVSTAATGIAALTINTGLAASNAAAAAALATTAATQVSTATAKFSANGLFADATIALPAFAALNAANTVLQTANGSVQSAAGTVTSQNATLTLNQSTAITALSPLLSAANLALDSANGALSALTTAGVPTSTTTASSLLIVAQTAATAAQTAATQAITLQRAGDFAGAQAQLTIAQQQQQVAANALTNANLVLTAVVNANTAQSAATSITAAGLLSAATSAQLAGASAVDTTSTQLAAAQAKALTVQSNSVLAQYNNPAVASGNFTDGLLSMKPLTTGGAEQVTYGSATNSLNTNYVLDGNKSLVEIRNIGYQRSGFNYFVLPQIGNADITFSGGTAKDLGSDPNGVYYFGRWQGGLVNVRDLATTGTVPPFSDDLGLTSLHWIVGLVPGDSTLPATFGGPINNTQQIVGTANYSLAAATHPTDLQGNVGTLNSASLAANFSSQTLNATVGLSFSSTDPVNVSTRNLVIDAHANNVPIQATGFDAFVGAPYAPVITCAGTSCATGYVGSISGSFLSTATAGSTTGAVGTGAVMGYAFTPNIASPPPNQPLTDLIQGLGVLSTGAAPTVGVTNFSNTAVLRDDVLWPTTQVATGVNPTTTTYIVSDKNRENLINNLGGTPALPVTLTGPAKNTNFLFDANGNLVRVFDTPHVVFDLGVDVLGSSTQFAAPTPLAHAQLSFGGGGAASENYFDPSTQVRFGRWTGGVVNVTDLTTGNSYVESLVAPGGGNRSVQWLLAQSPSSLPITGEFHYTRINDPLSGTPSFATAPIDSYGNVGTLEGARVSADFTNMTASAGVRISMPSGPAGSFGIQNLSSRFDNAPILNGGFNVSSSALQNLPGTDNLHVSCFGPGCAPDVTLSTGVIVGAYGGRIRGAFDSATGNAGTADGAFLGYIFDTFYGSNGLTPPAGRVVDDYINGLVAFQQGPQIVLPTAASGVYSLTAPTAPVTALTTYSYNNGSNSNTSNERNWVDHPSAIIPASAPPTKFFVTDPSGNLVSITDDNQQHGDGNALTLNGGTANPATPISLPIGSVATATDGTILLGWQQPTGIAPLTVSGTDFNGCFGTGCALNPTPRTVLGDGLAWVRGPAPFPDYLAGAIASFSNPATVVTGTANYTLGASIVHDQNGIAGAVSSTSTTLGVNFNTASVNFAMTATTGDGTWNANAFGIRMQDGGSGRFNAFTQGGTIATIPTTSAGLPVNTHDNLNVILATPAGNVPGFGNIQGQLMGIGLGGAGVTFDLNSFLPCTIGPCSNVSASGALGFTIGGTGPFLTSASQPYSTLTAYQLFAFTSPMADLSGMSPTQLSQLSNGNLTDLSIGIRGGFVSPNRTQTVNNFPVKVDGEFPVIVTSTQTQPPPCTTGCTNVNVNVNNIPVVYAVTGATAVGAIPAPLSIGTATVTESGIDVATGIRWGRYGAGTIGVNDRITGASLGTIDVSTQNVHFIMSGVQSGPTILPTSNPVGATATAYTLVGNTSPTDSLGRVGTLTSASLSADFTHQTVDTAVNASVGGVTWGASATGIPIVGSVFQAGKKVGDTAGSLTVTSSLGANTAGQLAGVFTGATGNGVGMLYSLNHGGNIAINPAAVTVSGVAVFGRH